MILSSSSSNAPPETLISRINATSYSFVTPTERLQNQFHIAFALVLRLLIVFVVLIWTLTFFYFILFFYLVYYHNLIILQWKKSAIRYDIHSLSIGLDQSYFTKFDKCTLWDEVGMGLLILLSMGIGTNQFAWHGFGMGMGYNCVIEVGIG